MLVFEDEPDTPSDPYGCDGVYQVYLGEHLTNNKVPRGCQVQKGDAYVDKGVLHITTMERNDALFQLKIPLPAQVSNRDVSRGSFAGRFPWGQGKSLRCQAKLDVEEGRVRVDSFDDPTVWFEVALV